MNRKFFLHLIILGMFSSAGIAFCGGKDIRDEIIFSFLEEEDQERIEKALYDVYLPKHYTAEEIQKNLLPYSWNLAYGQGGTFQDGKGKKLYSRIITEVHIIPENPSIETIVFRFPKAKRKAEEFAMRQAERKNVARE